MVKIETRDNLSDINATAKKNVKKIYITTWKKDPTMDWIFISFKEKK